MIQHDFNRKGRMRKRKSVSASEEGKNRVEKMRRGLEERKCDKLLGPPGAVGKAANEIAKILMRLNANAKK